MWKHVQQATQADTNKLIQNYSKQQIKEAMQGKDMTRYKLYFNFPILDNYKEATTDLIEQLPYFLETKNNEKLITTLFMQIKQDYNDTEKYYTNLKTYVKQYPKVPTGYTLVPEDKDPAACWMVNDTQQALRAIWLVLQDDKWLFTTLTHEQLRKHKNQINQILKETKLFKKYTESELDSLPYAYHSIKPKCYSQEEKTAQPLTHAKKKTMDV